MCSRSVFPCFVDIVPCPLTRVGFQGPGGLVGHFSSPRSRALRQKIIMGACITHFSRPTCATGRCCRKSLLASLKFSEPSVQRSYNCVGAHHKAVNSPVTSATGLRVYRRAKVACFVSWQEICRKEVWDFFDSIGQHAKNSARSASDEVSERRFRIA